MRRTNGIALYFICLTLSAVMSLRGQWRNQPLREIVQELFTILNTASHTFPVKRLIWPVIDYEQCLDFSSSVRYKIKNLVILYAHVTGLISHNNHL